MKNWRHTGIALVSTVLLSVSAWAGTGPAGHSHDETYSAGEPNLLAAFGLIDPATVEGRPAPLRMLGHSLGPTAPE
jgi:hypothetical protein